MNRALDGHEVLDIAGKKTKLIVYEDLKNYKTLSDLLKPYGSVVILYEWQRQGNNSIGHYISVNKVKDSIEHFDSLMFLPDQELKMVPKNIRKSTSKVDIHFLIVYCVFFIVFASRKESVLNGFHGKDSLKTP